MPFAAWQPAARCTGGPTPGAKAIAAWFMNAYASQGARNDGIYNCLAGETLVLTSDGDIPIAELAGTDARLLTFDVSTGRSRWVDAPVRSYGVQPLMEVALERGVDRQIIHATPGHRWITRYRRSGVDGGGHGHVERTTADLAPGQVIPSVYPRSAASLIRHFHAGVPHGLVYGDGTIDGTGGARIALHGAKVALAEMFPNQVSSVGRGQAHDGEPYAVVTGLSRRWKKLPEAGESTAYLYGFLAGWFAADGRVNDSGAPTLYSADRDALEEARLIARQIGIGTYPVRDAKGGGNTIRGRWVEPITMHSLSFVMSHLDSSFFLRAEHRERFNAAPNGRRPADWRVVSVTPTDRVEEVYCAEVAGTETFVLAEHVLTANCRNVRGGSIMSAHAEGRAFDAGFPLVNGKANPAGDDLVQRLRPVANQLGIGVLIWDRRIWSAKSPGKAGRPYTGVDPHTGHVHIELTRGAAARLNLATVKHWLEGAGGVGRVARDLQQGDHGADVAALQRALHLTADGVFGPQTRAAVNAFKARHGGPQDGIAGPNTLRLLGLS